jgi:hypothetical protein
LLKGAESLGVGVPVLVTVDVAVLDSVVVDVTVSVVVSVAVSVLVAVADSVVVDVTVVEEVTVAVGMLEQPEQLSLIWIWLVLAKTKLTPVATLLLTESVPDVTGTAGVLVFPE